MIPAALLLATLLQGAVDGSGAGPAAAAGDACRGVYDATIECPSPAAVALEARGAAGPSALVDAAPPAEPARSDEAATTLAGRLAVIGTGALVGSAALAGLSYAYARQILEVREAGALTPERAADLAVWQQGSLTGAVALLVGAGLLYGASGAFLAFDPRSGSFLLPLFAGRDE